MAGREGRLPESLLREGLAMVQAVAADAINGGFDVTLLRDIGVPAIVAPGATIHDVDSRSSHARLFAEHAAEAEATLVIAPETDGALLQAVHAATEACATLTSPDEAFVRITSDKLATGTLLQDAAVPTPRFTPLEPDEPLPRDFEYPAITKPVDGAGSQDLFTVTGPDDRPPAYAWRRLLQTYQPGMACSVAAIGVAGSTPLLLPACRQRLSTDGLLRYQGGATPLPAGLDERVRDLAKRTLAAMPPLIGYAGIDLVLGDDPAGGRDYVIEINPRITTSFVALRAALQGGSLVRAMYEGATGHPPALGFDPRPLEFDADGTVYYA